jgi:hypothetical protein
LDRSAVVAVYIDLGVVCFVDESGQFFAFAVFLVVFQEFFSVPHYLSCIDIVFSSWLLVVGCFWFGPEIAGDYIVVCDVGSFEESA